MAARSTGVFAEAAARPDKRDPVPEEHAGERVTNDPAPLRLPDETVAAMARVFRSAVADGHRVNAMTEEAAQITDLLPEARQAAVRVGLAFEQQRVAAADARILGVPVATNDFLVGVMT